MVKLPKKQKTNDSPLVSPPFDLTTGVSLTGPGSKEKEIFERQDQVALEEIRKDLELGTEVKEAGVESLTHEEIELPPSVKQMGVTQNVEEAILPQAAPVLVPLADEQILQGTGTGASVWASLTWLAQWCLRQLKKARVKLKKIHGKIVRVVVR